MQKLTYLCSTGWLPEFSELEDGTLLFQWGGYVVEIDQLNTVFVKHYGNLLGKFIANPGIVSVAEKHQSATIVAALEAYDIEEGSEEKYVSLRTGATLITVTSLKDGEVNEVHVVVAVDGESIVIRGKV